MDIDDFIPRVRTYARSIPDPTAQRVIREAAKVLCRETHLWKQNDTVTITDPEESQLGAFPDATAFGILSARMNDRDLTPVTEQQLDTIEPGWAFETAVDDHEPVYILAPAPDTIRLYPLGTGQLQVRWLLEPSDTAFTLPDWMGLHAALIAKGAAGMAMMMPGTDFFQPDLGMKHEKDFKREIDAMKMKASRTVVRATHHTRGRYF